MGHRRPRQDVGDARHAAPAPRVRAAARGTRRSRPTSTSSRARGCGTSASPPPRRSSASSSVIGEALEGRELTREELAATVEEITGDDALTEHLRETWGATLKPAAFRGRLVFAPSRARTSGSPGRRTPSARRSTRRSTSVDAPLPRRLRARPPRGPVALVGRGNALSAAKAQKRFEALGDEAVEVRRRRRERCWALADDARRDARPPSPRASPGCCRSSTSTPSTRTAASRPCSPRRDRDAVFRQAGWISPVILVDGAIAGVWKHERQGATVQVELSTVRGAAGVGAAAARRRGRAPGDVPGRIARPQRVLAVTRIPAVAPRGRKRRASRGR